MSGPMTEPREALATSICSTFDMGHHHHEAFLQPDHCDDGLSDADELLRSLRAQGYSVARSEGPGLDAPSLDEGLLAGTFSCPLGCGLIDMAALDNHLASHGYTYRVWSKRERP